METAFERIIEQAEKRDITPRGLEGFPLGLYGLTIQQVRMGNVMAIATVALRHLHDDA
jgi:hypothetical protein